jgi:hypothetical protein
VNPQVRTGRLELAASNPNLGCVCPTLGWWVQMSVSLAAPGFRFSVIAQSTFELLDFQLVVPPTTSIACASWTILIVRAAVRRRATAFRRRLALHPMSTHSSNHTWSSHIHCSQSLSIYRPPVISSL